MRSLTQDTYMTSEEFFEGGPIQMNGFRITIVGSKKEARRKMKVSSRFTCRKCGEEFKVNEASGVVTSGGTGTCRPCKNKYDKEWRDKLKQETEEDWEGEEQWQA